MPRDPWISIILAAAAAVFTVACAEERESSVRVAERESRLPEWNVKTACPSSISIRGGPTCKLVTGKVKLRSCDSVRHPGGSAVMVSGISCRAGAKLILPLVHPFSNYKERRQALYRPSVVVYEPFESRPTGWTCWASFDPARPVVQHVCWRGKAVVTWRFS